MTSIDHIHPLSTQTTLSIHPGCRFFDLTTIPSSKNRIWCSIATSPAVNAGAVRKNEPSNVSLIQSTMETRIRSVLAVARQHGHNAIVLGAWGCGVFGNKPSDIAHWFANALHEDLRFAGALTGACLACWTSLTKHRHTKTSARSSQRNRTQRSREPEHSFTRQLKSKSSVRSRLRPPLGR